MAGLADSPSFVLVLIISAFVPPLVFMAWIRNTARYGKEPWWNVLKAFVWGAVLSVLVAIVASVVLLVALGRIESVNDFFARRFTDPTIAIGALSSLRSPRKRRRASASKPGDRRRRPSSTGSCTGRRQASDSRRPRTSSTAWRRS